MPIGQTAHYAIQPAGVDAVKAAITEFVYRPCLADGPVVFTDYTEVAANQRD
jgi:hypothetical protein